MARQGTACHGKKRGTGMGDNLTIFKKGLFLIAIPLLFQLVVIGLMIWSQRAGAEAQRMSNHSKDVIAFTEGTFRYLTESHSEVRSLVISGDQRLIGTYRRAIDRVRERLDTLTQLVADNPPQQSKVLAITAEIERLRNWLDTTVSAVLAGDSQTALIRIKTLEGRSILGGVRARFDDFLVEEDRLDRARQASLESTWRRQNQLLAGSIGVSLALAVGMTWLFSRGISGRLAVLTENTRSLASGKGLAAPLQGDDEIGRLDRVFHDMVRSLAARDRENEMFIYSVSHDLRSPLVNLQGFGKELALVCAEVRGLLDGELTPAARGRAVDLLDRDVPESLQFIQAAVSRLAAIIDALLRLSRAGRVEYRAQAVDVAASVARIVESLDGTLDERGVQLTTANLPPAWGDPTAIEQIFANLINNAVNYLDPKRPGRIEVGVLDDGPSQLPAFHTYYVKDNGQGIADDYMPKLFLAFQRFHKDAASGEGIGLTLIRRAVERHGGTIRVESEPGVGSTFLVTLPSQGFENSGLAKHLGEMERGLHGS
jgi:signal transduction histidine kinase